MSRITVTCEYKMKTPLSFETECKAELDVWEKWADPKTIDKVVKWCKKAVSLKSVNHPMVTFTYDNNSPAFPYGKSTSRVICQWGMSWDLVKWEYVCTSRPIPQVTEGVKPDAKLFRELYLECIDKLAWEEQGNEK